MDINDLSPDDLRLSILKPFVQHWQEPNLERVWKSNNCRAALEINSSEMTKLKKEPLLYAGIWLFKC